LDYVGHRQEVMELMTIDRHDAVVVFEPGQISGTVGRNFVNDGRVQAAKS
jgi:hypothetical protein